MGSNHLRPFQLHRRKTDATKNSIVDWTPLRRSISLMILRNNPFFRSLSQMQNKVNSDLEEILGILRVSSLPAGSGGGGVTNPLVLGPRDSGNRCESIPFFLSTFLFHCYCLDNRNNIVFQKPRPEPDNSPWSGFRGRSRWAAVAAMKNPLKGNPTAAKAWMMMWDQHQLEIQFLPDRQELQNQHQWTASHLGRSKERTAEATVARSGLAHCERTYRLAPASALSPLRTIRIPCCKKGREEPVLKWHCPYSIISLLFYKCLMNLSPVLLYPIRLGILFIWLVWNRHVHI